MILNNENMEPDKISNMEEISYDTLYDAVISAIGSVVSIGKIVKINGFEYKVYSIPSNIVFKQDEVYDKELGSIFFQIQLDNADSNHTSHHTRPTLHCEFDVKVLKGSSDGEKHVWFDTNTYRMNGGEFQLSDSELEFYMAEE